LLFDEEIIEGDDLILPHPRMSFRRFVLQPAAEIAPEMVYPVTASRINELLGRLDRGPHYVAIGGFASYISSSHSWLAKRLKQVMDCTLFRSRGLAMPDFAYSSTSRPGVKIVEFYKCWARALCRERWHASPQLHPLLEQSGERAVDALQTPPAVSDFWFEEWRFIACLLRTEKNGNSPATPEDHRLLEELEELSQTVVSPKLVIWLDTFSASSADIEKRWSACLVQTFRQSPCGPLLRLDTDDRDWMLSESIAAIKAMQPLDGDVS
jgi:hypothetical protein